MDDGGLITLWSLNDRKCSATEGRAYRFSSMKVSKLPYLITFDLFQRSKESRPTRSGREKHVFIVKHRRHVTLHSIKSPTFNKMTCSVKLVASFLHNTFSHLYVRILRHSETFQFAMPPRPLLTRFRARARKHCPPGTITSPRAPAPGTTTSG